jgi:hypothetical protein
MIQTYTYLDTVVTGTVTIHKTHALCVSVAGCVMEEVLACDKGWRSRSCLAHSGCLMRVSIGSAF